MCKQKRNAFEDESNYTLGEALRDGILLALGLVALYVSMWIVLA